LYPDDIHMGVELGNPQIVLEEEKPSTRTDLQDWTAHWADTKQDSRSQRFFSFYRKTVFSRTVGFYINRFFPQRGIFLEAGSGTSETSIRINKWGGNRVLIAFDLIPTVLSQTDEIMDRRVCGDIFKLPFPSESIDGIWNVGVMEHFLHPQIDQILTEFHRVLKKDAPLLVLWPAKYSIPQRLLRILETVIRVMKRGEVYHFHPPEISQLRSMQEGLKVYERNGFSVREIDPGLKSWMAFITIIGNK
jgi:SAM-dependent methyltransferase